MDGRQQISRNNALLKDALRGILPLMESGNYEEAMQRLHAAGNYAWLHSCGQLACVEIEDLIVHLSEALPAPQTPQPQPPEPFVATVLTSIHAAGGHSRLAWRWVQLDRDRRHQVILTNQGSTPIPAQLLELVDTGRVALTLLDAEPTLWGRATQLRQLVTDAEAVILHIHPDDPIAPVAVARMSAGRPVLFVDHATHVFWMGACAANLVITLSSEACRTTATRRGVPATQICWWPFSSDLLRLDGLPRLPVRESLNIPADAVTLLTSGWPYKFRAIEGVSFSMAIAPVLASRPNTHLIAVGPAADAPEWKDLLTRFAGRIHLLGVQDEQFMTSCYHACDVYLDSIPFSSGSAVMEAAALGKPIIKFATQEMRDSGFAADLDTVPLPAYNWTDLEAYRNSLLDLIDMTPDERAKLGSIISSSIRNWHNDDVCRFFLEKAYSQAKNSAKIQIAADLVEEKFTPLDRLLIALGDNYRLCQGDKLAAPTRLLAFYLPQFHSIPENDCWWGKGFTEWTNVKQAKPLFDGHYQPHEPGELGYYDLSDISVMEKQARLARQYGLEGFCFYYYWFDGKRLLEKPVDQLLVHPEIDLPFCLCWANENWTRRWDGGNQEILIEQSYTPENNVRFAQDFLPYLRDTRYIKVNGKPLILIYRPDLIPDIKCAAETWRQVWRDSGVGEVLLANVESFTAPDPRQIGFDASVEFPPQLMSLDRFRPNKIVTSDSDPLLNPGDYNKIADFWESRPSPKYKRFRAIVPSWDNASRRRKGNASVLIGATPERYEAWLTKTVHQTMIEFDGDERLVFINAWNEWGEGCHLEPDLRHGRAYLEATANAMRSVTGVDVYFGRYINPYQRWLASRQLSHEEGAQLANSLGKAAQFTFVIDATDGSAERLATTLRSFSAQQYERFHMVAVTPLPPPVNQGQFVSWLEAKTDPAILLHELAQSSPENWFCLIQAGDQITESGLLLLASHLSRQPQVGLAYADEDELDANYGPSNPVFRPDFDPDYLRSYPYIGRFLLFRGREYRELAGLNWGAGSARFYDYALRFYESYGENSIGHLPAILFHALQSRSEEEALTRYSQALIAHLQRCRVPAELEPGQLPVSFRVRYRHDDHPLVSVIIPTKNHLQKLQRCLETLLEKTAYTHYEILLVDNQSTDADAVSYLRGLIDLNLPNLRVLSYPHPFNPADMNNLAANEARGTYLVLLSNDTAIVKTDWLDALLNHAQRPEVGITGAKLLSPDGRVQSGGEVLGLCGPASPVFVGEALDAPGYFGRLLLDQQYSAVTTGCLVVRKSVYDKVGGMDGSAFPENYSNVDLCMKVRAAGYRVIWTPHALVMNKGAAGQSQFDVANDEAKQRHLEAKQRAMYRKWLPALISDPAYNPNLSLDDEGFALETDPLFNPNSSLFVPKVLAHHADEHGSGRYRVIQPLQALVASHFASGATRECFLDTIHIAKLAPDVVVLQRQHSDAELSCLQDYREFSGAKIAYDLDDYLPNLPVSSSHKKDFPKDILRRLRQATSFCDRVTVSTAMLKEALGDLHSDIVILPNYLPPNSWNHITPRPERKERRKARVGWAGGISHTGDLRLIIDVVRALANKVDWVFFGMQPENVGGCVAEYYPGVPIDQYPEQLASLDLDLALAPLEQCLFNECKSNLRLLEYGICGYPVVATDIEPYRCGLPVTLVKNRFKDWIAAINEKLTDLEALHAEGAALQSAVRQNWMLEGNNLLRWRDGWMLDHRK